jgi:ergothioneine biosynthesis protein EgtB
VDARVQFSPAGSIEAAAGLAGRFAAVRAASLALAAPLSAEDMGAQSMPDASPVKWHLAHTTWFFDCFVLAPHAGVTTAPEGWGVLFNSYYEAAGPRHPRPQRGLLTRPGLDEVVDWRGRVDQTLAAWLASGSAVPEALALVELGLQHEQQHQELILTDLKHLLSLNPLYPAYHHGAPAAALEAASPAAGWLEHPGGLVEIGHAGPGFAFDNETPRHRVWLEPFALADRPVSCGEWLDFMADGGYRTPTLWLSDGWAAVQQQGWQAPLYWSCEGEGGWRQFTLLGERAIDPAEPVCHVSHYEADAFARWAGARLPSEAEWEALAPRLPADPAPALPHPAVLRRPTGPGRVWEWTASAYLPYPGYRPLPGAVGEYNGKFMSGQMVLRGGSWASPPGHARPAYRNFFPPAARWQAAGLRLAREVAS